MLLIGMYFYLLIEHVKKYATKEAIDAAEDNESDDDDMSSIDAFSDDEAPGMEL
jgi:ubiquitin-conjugating enzyme E2 H